MAERQQHGFNFENAVKSFLGAQNNSYTAEWDAENNISIKFIGSGTIDMGSIVRIFTHLQNPGWTMILGRHSNKVCHSVYELTFTEEVCKALRGHLTLEMVTEFDNTVKSFVVGQHKEARAYAKMWKLANKLRMGLLTVQPKIDSKNQRRVQCGINNTAFKKLFPNAQLSKRFESLVGVNFA